MMHKVIVSPLYSFQRKLLTSSCLHLIVRDSDNIGGETVKRKTSTDLNSRLVREGDDALPRKMGDLTAGTVFGYRLARPMLPR
jgi:hypothetical protein